MKSAVSRLAWIALWAIGSSNLAAQSVITVAVTPRVTQGFVDIDEGTRDAIADVTKALKQTPGVRVVDTGAQVTLVIVGRDVVHGGDTVTIPSGGAQLTVGGTHPVIRSVITVGSYEHPLISTKPGTWSAVAKQVVRDLLVWIDANRKKLK